MNESGIYCIRNSINNKCYVGQSKNVKKRFIHHKSMLRKNEHNNPYLQNSWNKYGEKHFVFEILEYCNIQELTEKEKYYLSIEEKYYNLKDVIDSAIHPKRKHSKEVLEKISISLKGKIPKNLKNIQKLRKRKVAYYKDNILQIIFNSCTEASNYFNIAPNSFNNYIGKQKNPNKKYNSKYFGLNYKIEYYE